MCRDSLNSFRVGVSFFSGVLNNLDFGLFRGNEGSETHAPQSRRFYGTMFHSVYSLLRGLTGSQLISLLGYGAVCPPIPARPASGVGFYLLRK